MAPWTRRTHEILQEVLSWGTAVVATTSLYFILSSRAGAGAQVGDGPSLSPERARALTASTVVLECNEYEQQAPTPAPIAGSELR